MTALPHDGFAALAQVPTLQFVDARNPYFRSIQTALGTPLPEGDMPETAVFMHGTKHVALFTNAAFTHPDEDADVLQFPVWHNMQEENMYQRRPFFIGFPGTMNDPPHHKQGAADLTKGLAQGEQTAMGQFCKRVEDIWQRNMPTFKLQPLFSATNFYNVGWPDLTRPVIARMIHAYYIAIFVLSGTLTINVIGYPEIKVSKGWFVILPARFYISTDTGAETFTLAF